MDLLAYPLNMEAELLHFCEGCGLTLPGGRDEFGSNGDKLSTY